jgi:hypothetical protein
MTPRADSAGRPAASDAGAGATPWLRQAADRRRGDQACHLTDELPGAEGAPVQDRHARRVVERQPRVQEGDALVDAGLGVAGAAVTVPGPADRGAGSWAIRMVRSGLGRHGAARSRRARACWQAAFWLSGWRISDWCTAVGVHAAA